MNKTTRDAIVRRLEKLTALGGGRLTPDAVVRDAKSKTSPLHSQFEWDDAAAAHQHRLDQARTLIRSVEVEITVHDRTFTTVRYVRDPSAGDLQGYIESTSLRSDKTLARDALLSELKTAQAMVDRAYELALVIGLESEFGEMRVRVQKLREKVVAAAA